jgi:hypothetical protein
MKKSLTICAVCLVLMTGSQGRANIAVIASESLADLEVVDDPFSGLGPDFPGAAGVLSQSQGSLNWEPFPTYSGDKVVYDDPFPGIGTIGIDAVGPSWMAAGGYVAGNTDVTFSAYASDSSAPATGSGTGLSPNIFLSVSDPNFAYAEFTDSGNAYAVDDFANELIPPLGAILLCGVGAGLIGWLRRRTTL